MYHDMGIYYANITPFNDKLIDIMLNVRSFIRFDEQNKIIDKYYKKYYKMDFTNKLKEKIYRYVHKNEGSIDEIGEFILNTQKELVAYMKKIIPQETWLSYEKIIEERGLLTIYKEKIEKVNSLFKEANVKEEIKQIIDNGVKKGRDMQILGEENFTPEVVEYIHKNKAKVAIDKLERSEAENLGFKYSDDVRLTIDSEAIQHTLKRHGAESDLVKNSGQIPVEYKDIAEYRNIVKNADESLRARDNAGNDVIVSYRQINGYAVVVEQIRKKNNELSFKTMFKQNGDYKNSKSYKETSALNQTLSIGYEPSANSFSKTEAPQKAVNESIAENEAKKSLFESSENFYDYHKKLLREISIEGLDKQNAKDKLYANTFQTYMEKVGNFEENLSTIVHEVRPFLRLNQKDKIIDKFFRLRDKKDFKNSLKELVYLYVHKDKLGIDDIHRDTMDYAESMAKYVKGLLPYDNHLSFEKLVKEKKLFDEVIRQENKPSVKPLDEFGINFEGFKGKEAVDKLLSEKRGQVKGAFYKEGLGEIDLVWGDENFGLRHIIDKHGDEFEDIAAELDEIIAKGVLEKGEHRYFIKHNDYKGMIALDYKGKESNAWILTLYKDKSALNPAYQHQIKHNTNTSSETRANGEFENSNIKNANLQKEKVDKLFHGDAEVISAQGKFNELEALNLTDEDIIPQQKIKFAMEKFNYDEKKAKDLLEWHKNSHALTKDENGLPKVFYHGTYSKFRVFRRVGKASQQGFFFTPSQKATEEYGDITLNTFLNIKNPFRADELKINKEADLQKWADILKLDYDKEKYESFKDLKTKLEKVKEATKKAGFKFHSASGGSVYVIDNKGRNSFINLEELDKENKRVVEAFKGLETEDIYFYYVVRNEFDLVLYALNKNDRYFHTSGRDEVKRVLEKLGYDGAVLNDTIITVFNSNQIKHIDNKGSFTDTKGNVTSKKPKNKEAEFSYFNEKSDNIYHSNPHLGAGLVGGVLNGVEQDENGNLSFDPVKFAMGFLGGSVGSFALKKGFQILEKNPELKEKIINELADTLAQGFEKAREKYPLLSTLEPRYIVQNEKGRKIQAKTMLKELEREQKGLYNVAFNGKNAVLIKKDLEAVDEAILFEKGTKRKGGKHIRLAHSTEPSQEGYVTKQEVANLGVNIREYLKNYEPFIDKNGARLYEWKDENGVKFRAVVNNTQTSGGNSHLPSASEEIITFYSDRNLKEKMNFKNPLLKDTIAESTMQGEALSKELESKEANTHTLREQTKELLKPFTHKLIKNKNDNTKAIVTMSGIKEMLSAKAINQSVKNGFKAKQHIKAVMALPTLFENAVFKDKQAQRHFKDYVEAYRVYSADFEGGKAIISVQERKIGNDVLYFLKLDELRLNNA
ncbi:hypothetical protein RA720_001540 [Campylobacter upsaliensis]|nr:hypothetical protein [Campylobacter upsaliensis]